MGKYVVGNLIANADATILKLIPDKPLEPNTQYSNYGVSRGTTDLSGNTEASSNGIFSFTTGAGADDTAPSLVSISIKEGLSGLPINTRFRVRFDEPVRLPVIDDGWGLQDVQGNAIPARIVQDDGARVVELIPQTLFNPDSSYTVSYGTVTDSVGNVASISGSVSFSTGNGIDLQSPKLLSTNPERNQTNVDRSLPAIELQFDDSIDITYIDEESFELTRTDTNAPVKFEVSTNNSEVIVGQIHGRILIKPLTGFESGISYRLQYSNRYYDLVANRAFLGGTLNFTVQ